MHMHYATIVEKFTSYVYNFYKYPVIRLRSPIKFWPKPKLLYYGSCVLILFYLFLNLNKATIISTD